MPINKTSKFFEAPKENTLHYVIKFKTGSYKWPIFEFCDKLAHNATSEAVR